MKKFLHVNSVLRNICYVEIDIYDVNATNDNQLEGKIWPIVLQEFCVFKDIFSFNRSLTHRETYGLVFEDCKGVENVKRRYS